MTAEGSQKKHTGTKWRRIHHPDGKPGGRWAQQMSWFQISVYLSLSTSVAVRSAPSCPQGHQFKQPKESAVISSAQTKKKYLRRLEIRRHAHLKHISSLPLKLLLPLFRSVYKGQQISAYDCLDLWFGGGGFQLHFYVDIFEKDTKYYPDNEWSIIFGDDENDVFKVKSIYANPNACILFW